MKENYLDFIQSGKMYNDLADILIQTRQTTMRALLTYNNLYGTDELARKKILSDLLGSVGESAFFELGFRCEFGKHIHIGERFYSNFDCILLDGAEIRIGDDVLFGPRVGIFTTNHAIDPEERAAGACYAKPVSIGNKVWLGANVTVNQGVTIGENTIIGSGSVVTKDIPANVIAVGNPCRVLRTITEADKTDYFSTLMTP
ncbi:sugar O-acetyltransferase [Enterococcus thailandicus]|uniref:sugar O-acetyltransferase n=1 Tax=Enterococcus thailandicus TaxID=417368 RepID=UPI0022EC0C11|nr:sugar O-acetyltransferase [Enterococcus thailandicus]MDA3974038.1 sugar O-acetyltransferase [Enterococcus thailandicus]MDA3976800.1 sugar O-acetyltransferase [Enterococcus thailandicus]MDA3981492.1 sugar O-acetyltransferase [Enterococcus thailandicus]